MTGPTPRTSSSSGAWSVTAVARAVWFGRQFGVEGEDASGEADRFVAADSACGGGDAGRAPGGDRSDRGGREGSAGVDVEVDGAQQRGERVDRPGAFAGHLVTGGGQYAQDGAISGSAGSAQLLIGETAGGAGEFGGVEVIGLAVGSAHMGGDVRCLGDDEPGGGEPLGEHRSVGADAVDEDQDRAAVGAVLDPGQGSA